MLQYRAAAQGQHRMYPLFVPLQSLSGGHQVNKERQDTKGNDSAGYFQYIKKGLLPFGFMWEAICHRPLNTESGLLFCRIRNSKGQVKGLKRKRVRQREVDIAHRINIADDFPFW